MSVKALGIAIKLSIQGDNQFLHPHIWAFVAVVIVCGLTQLNYLNMVGAKFGFIYVFTLLNDYLLGSKELTCSNIPGIGCI